MESDGVNNWQLPLPTKFKTKLLSAVCLTSCCFMFHTPFNVFAKESTNANKDMMISYKNQRGKSFIRNNVTKVEKVLNQVKMIRASINEEQYKLLKANNNIDFINSSRKKMIIANEPTLNTTVQMPVFKSYWNLDDVKAPSYWKKGYLGKGIKVAVIDTGINAIPDLTNVVKRVSFVKDNPTTKSIDESDPWDRGNFGEGHGTSVAAVIGAQIGGTTFNHEISDIIGVAPNVQLYSLKYADGTRDGRIAEVVEAIDWSIKHKMDLINISSSVYENDPSLQKAIDLAVKSGIIIVASAGNDGNYDKPTYPARYSNVIAVGSIGKDKKCSIFSNTGTSIDFTAPGDYVPSINSGGKFFYASGTSFAAPHVTGLLAILKERYPYSTASELVEKLEDSSLDLGLKGKDNKYGYGLAQLPKFTTTKPKGLTNSKITNIKDHSASLSFTLPKDSTFHKVAIIINDKTVKYATKSPYTLNHLHENKSYNISLKVINKNGDSSDAMKHSFQTLEDESPPSEISKLKVTSLKIHSLNLSWENPIDQDLDLIQILINDQLVDTTKDENFSIKGLKPNSKYQIKLIAEDTTGNISEGDLTTVHTPVAKTIPAPSVDPITTSSHSISGKTVPSTSVYIKDSSKTIAKGKADKDGKFLSSIPFQAFGSILLVTVEDSVGNKSSDKKLVVEQSKTTANPIVKQVYTTTKYIRGEAEVGSTVSVHLGNRLLVSDKVDSKGHFFFYIGNQPSKSVLYINATNINGVKSKSIKMIVK